MNTVSGNKVRYIVISALRTTALLCASGPLLQTFVETLGFDSQFNYIHTTLLQVVNVLTIILGANWADKGNIIKRTALLEVPMALMYFVYVPFCFFKFGDGDAYLPFLLLLSVGLVQMLCVGLHTVCDYKMPYFLFKVEEYGVVTAISGVVGSFVMCFHLSIFINQSPQHTGGACICDHYNRLPNCHSGTDRSSFNQQISNPIKPNIQTSPMRL